MDYAPRAAGAAAIPPRGAYMYIVRTQEKAYSSDSRFKRKLSGTTGIVFWERRDLRCCVRQHGSGYVYLQSLWIYTYTKAYMHTCIDR